MHSATRAIGKSRLQSGLHRLLGCDGGVYLGAVDFIKAQGIIDLNLRQVVLGGDLGGRHFPLMSGYDDGLDADARAAQDGGGLSRSAAPVRDVGVRGIIHALV